MQDKHVTKSNTLSRFKKQNSKKKIWQTYSENITFYSEKPKALPLKTRNKIRIATLTTSI